MTNTKYQELSREQGEELLNKYKKRSKIGSTISATVCFVGIGICGADIFLEDKAIPETPLSISYDNTISDLNTLYEKKKAFKMEISNFQKNPAVKASNVVPAKSLPEISDYLMELEKGQLEAVDNAIINAKIDSSRIANSEEYKDYSAKVAEIRKPYKTANLIGIVAMALGYMGLFVWKEHYADKRKNLETYLYMLNKNK